ncbi:C-terminal binding protein [Nocardia fusca]|uniref:C-terminal binding protein n=1 Tax=Nocardia fusca TaxID=941183 RepID=UPI0037CAA76D
MTRRVLVVDHAWPDLHIEREVLDGVDLLTPDSDDIDELASIAPTVDAIMVNWRPLPGKVLKAATRCRTVARFGVGVDNIDVDCATDLGIVVSRVVDYCVDEVAEHTIALLFALRRNIVAFSQQTSSGDWDNTAFGPMRRIRGTSLGILGWGAIGRAVATRAHALGMQVEAFSRSSPADGWPTWVRAAQSVHELASRVDHLSIHLPLTEQTMGLVDESVLRVMRPSAVVLNAARGPIVDSEALSKAVRERRIAGAGIDVLDGDPPSPNNPLIGMDNVIVTPHAAFNSVESVETLRREAAHNVLAVLEGRPPSNVANPEVFDRSTMRRFESGTDE